MGKVLAAARNRRVVTGAAWLLGGWALYVGSISLSTWSVQRDVARQEARLRAMGFALTNREAMYRFPPNAQNGWGEFATITYMGGLSDGTDLPPGYLPSMRALARKGASKRYCHGTSPAWKGEYDAEQGARWRRVVKMFLRDGEHALARRDTKRLTDDIQAVGDYALMLMRSGQSEAYRGAGEAVNAQVRLIKRWLDQDPSPAATETARRFVHNRPQLPSSRELAREVVLYVGNKTELDPLWHPWARYAADSESMEDRIVRLRMRAATFHDIAELCDRYDAVPSAREMYGEAISNTMPSTGSSRVATLSQMESRPAAFHQPSLQWRALEDIVRARRGDPPLPPARRGVIL